MISKQIFSLNFMFLCSSIEELCRKEESDKTGCDFNFGHEYNIANQFGNLLRAILCAFTTGESF